MTTFRPSGMLGVLNRHGVRYVLIGGLAGVAQGSPLVTGDLDICYQRTDENMRVLAAALVELKATLRGAPPDLPFLLDARTIKAGDCFTFTTSDGSLDCLGTPAGTAGYEDLASRATAMTFNGLTVQVASVDDLIRMKQAAGRQKDIDAIFHLRALRDRIEGRGD